MSAPAQDTGRTLNVIDAHRAPWALLHGLAHLAESGRHRVLLLGNTRDDRRAHDAGIRRAERIQPRNNEPSNATRTIRHALRGAAAFDRVIAWDERTRLALGGLASGAPSDAVRSVDATFPADAIGRPALRRQWRVGDDTRVLIPADDHPSRVDAMRLCYIVGILSVAGAPSVAVVPREARDLDRAARFAWRHGRAPWLIIDDRPPLALRNGADAAWWQASEPPDTGLTLRVLMRAGLPAAADRAEQTEAIASDRLRLCDPCNELSAVTALTDPPTRTDERPDPDAFRRAVDGSVAGPVAGKASLARSGR